MNLYTVTISQCPIIMGWQHFQSIPRDANCHCRSHITIAMLYVYIQCGIYILHIKFIIIDNLENI